MTGRSAELVHRIINGDETVRIFVPIIQDIEATERPITVDQTNESVVVGEKLVVKWMRTPAPDRSTRILAHLAANGFRRMPTPHAALFDGDNLVALVTEFLPDGQDGYDWCVDDLLAELDGGPPTRIGTELDDSDGSPPTRIGTELDGSDSGPPTGIGAELGALTAEMHAALATPSVHIPHPIFAAAPADGWADLLDEALATADVDESPATATEPWAPATDAAEWLRSMRPRLAADLDSPARRNPGPAIHLHGDLHVGQILRWRDGYAVIDFDGNPTRAARAEPVARDVAQLRMSVLHVAEIANKRTGGRHRDALVEWGRRAADDLLTAYGKGLDLAGLGDLFRGELLRPFEVEQECRELVYADRFLPRWRYAPVGVLRSWYG
ncbi:hypothetical protein JIG36_40930 [Actinoplanes sp. LDG1-06]|uniref:Glucosamine kinase n=1 Tax=Paractinoplanes ovalisporus TaxID=2810368 RepID=A0ABS2APU4_9ACTN|nr:hypothetical protein [Actinoplanes ovalisporus]MBM2621884.1 hypothetical protein [Actinoplanes ovalisporus]